MSWNFNDVTRVGAESALDACDYFVDEVIEPWKVLGTLPVLALTSDDCENVEKKSIRKVLQNFILFRFSRTNSFDEAQRVA